ncbi:unnamed protein product [Hydatigera taeniaeformis]|uniref:Clathrin_bdg domain-containing protein n=1 Tax=Hydatigena taeniaeformis TaxID=6205 RepID=A0A0R3X5Q9_HYDTA|nr:unnamed protein product [Hydatigera taeniaeformis]
MSRVGALDFDSLNLFSARVDPKRVVGKTFNEVGTPDQSLNNSDFEMPPKFPPGASVGDLASHLARVMSSPSLSGCDTNVLFDKNILTLKSREYEFGQESALQCRRISLVADGRHCGTPAYNVDRRHAVCNGKSPPIHFKSKFSSSESCDLDIRSTTSGCAKCPDSSKFSNDAQIVNSEFSMNAGENASTFFFESKPVLKGLEHYSRNSSEIDTFDEFAAFQSAESEQDFFDEFGTSQKAFDADFSGFKKPNHITENALPAYPLVKNLLVHTHTALEAAFFTDKEAGLNTFVPSELSPKSVSAFRARQLALWERASSEAVQKYHGRLKLLEPTPIENRATAPANPSSSHSLPSESDAVATASVPQIPIPEFDWSASGLTNPFGLESSVHSASEADLESFEEMSSIATSKPPAPISDIEAEFLHSVAPPPQTTPTQSLPITLRPFDVYVGKSKTAAATKAAEVPECVSKVLALLPDFSYLRKSILAFPVLDQTE